MSKPLKILYIITKSNLGGAQKYVFELACKAKENGYEVTVACGGTGAAGATTGPLVTKLSEQKIPFIVVKNFVRNMSFVSDILAFFEVWKIIRKVKPDVLHVSSSKAGGIGALAGRLSLVPRIIFTSHGLTTDETWRPRWQQFLIYLGTWITIRLSHFSIMISTDTFKRASQMPGLLSRVRLIKNGVTPIKFFERGEARAKLAPHVPQKSLWIGGIGELHPNKNWSAAIISMSTLSPKNHLLIIGEGEEKLKLEELISQHNLSEQVHLLGYINAAQYLKAFDIFILPSKKEGLPYVLLEAGLAGVATIASDLPGNHDIIESGQSGLLVKPTPQLISTSLEILLRDEGMRRNLGSNLKQNTETNFSLEKMCQQTFDLYQSRTLSD